MNDIKLVCRLLEGMGLVPTVNGNMITVMFEMKELKIAVEAAEDKQKGVTYRYITVHLYTYCLTSEDDVAEVLVACNKANRMFRHVKTYLDDTLQFVETTDEFWYVNETDLKNSLEHALFMLSGIRSNFVHELRRVQRESNAPADAAAGN